MAVIRGPGSNRVVDAPSGATLTAADSGKCFTNAGAVGGVSFILPTPIAADLIFEFHLRAADGNAVAIPPPGGVTMRYMDTVYAAGATLSSDQRGSNVVIRSLSTTEYEVVSVTGIWVFAD